MESRGLHANPNHGGIYEMPHAGIEERTAKGRNVTDVLSLPKATRRTPTPNVGPTDEETKRFMPMPIHDSLNERSICHV
jgi:hypothetical protein